jgi:hypothetical protein
MAFFGSERLRGEDNTGNDQQDWPKFQKTEAGVFADQEKYADGDDHQWTHQAANLAVGAVANRSIWIAHFGPLGILVQTIPKDPSADQDQRHRPAFGKPLALQQAEVPEQHQNADANQEERADRLAVGSFD